MKKYLALLAIVSVFLIFLAGIGAEYSLNDDWLYSAEAKQVLDGRIEEIWLLPQSLFGAGISYIFGYSLLTLRLSMMFAGIIAVLVFFVLGVRLGLSEKHSFLASLVLLLNPFFYSLSHTFMTDVFFLLLFMVSIYFFVQWSKKEEKKYLVLGLAFSYLAFLVRPFAVVLPFTALFLSIKWNKSFREIFAGFFFTLLAVMSVPFMHTAVSANTSFGFSFGISNISRIFGIPMYLSFLVFPVVLLVLGKEARKRLWNRKTLVVLFSVLAAGSALYAFFNIAGHETMPYYGNVLNKNSLGFENLSGEKQAIFPEDIWNGLTALSGIALVLCIAFFDKKLLEKKENAFLFFSGLLLFVLMIAFNYYYDRFILPLFAVFALLLFQSIKSYKYFTHFLAATSLLFGVFSVAYTFEYLSWNDNAKVLTDELIFQGFDEGKINSTHEFCAVLEENSCSKECIDGTQVISFERLSNCSLVKKSSFYLPFGVKSGEIFVQR